MQNDCFYYLEESTDRIRAACLKCGQRFGYEWYWNGSKIGYGNNDVNCSICGEAIYRQEETFETDATNEDTGE